jgi:signal peptidase I
MSSPREIEDTRSSLPKPVDEHPTPRSLMSEILHLSFIALIVVLPIRMFIAQPFIVSGASMETTFTTGEYLIVDQVSYRFEEPARGDVIVFRYPKDPSKFFIKRIIGLPGDTVTVQGSTVTITNTEHPTGIVLDEDYVLEMTPSADVTETLGTDEFFVMGDNRDASSDSRMWGILPRDNIVGRALVRLYPLSTAGLWPGARDIAHHPALSSP